jgi:hypothetical protein
MTFLGLIKKVRIIQPLVNLVRKRRRQLCPTWLGLLALMFLVLPLSAQSWHTEVIDKVDNGPVQGVGKIASLVIDRHENIHIAYYNFSTGTLWYAFRPHGDHQWYKTSVDKNGNGTYISLAVDAEDRPHFAYNSHTESGLHYAFWDGKKWHKQLIDPEHTAYFTSIQVDAQGHPGISYYLYHASDNRTQIMHLKYASFDGQTWSIQTADQRHATGKFNSLSLDAAGRPHISYTQHTTGDLLYASWDGKHWTYSAPEPHHVNNSYVGNGNSIALDSAGHAHIAYLDITNPRVKYARWTGTAWQTEVVDQLSARAEVDHLSLQMDSQDRPRIAYYDAGSGALKYATRDTKGWHTEVVDRDGNVGLSPSLCLNSLDEAYIAYYDINGRALRLAHFERSTQASTMVNNAKP